MTLDAFVVSYALDTNGQNARFVRAAERWGSDASVLKAFAIGNQDPGGVIGRFGLAADKLGGLRIRSAHRSEAYFKFPKDLLWTYSNFTDIKRMAHEADVIHLNNSHRAYNLLRLRSKPALLHHHGTSFRTKPEALLAAAKIHRMTQAVSTIDLMQTAPELLHWLPTAYDLDALKLIGEANRRQPDGRIRVVSAPTSRMWKSTVELEAAVTSLQAEGLAIDLVLVENKPWDECLAIKATADIYFDQVILGYGCNAIEAWAMGIPVIAGADPWTLAKMAEVYNGPIPFYAATVDTIADAIRTLAASADLRAEWAATGLTHCERFHAERPALARLAELYWDAIGRKSATVAA